MTKPPASEQRCRACSKPLLPENQRVADGCPCNSPRGVNHGLVATNTCTCIECDPAQTGSTRYPHRPAPPEQPARCDGVRRVFNEESFEGECNLVDRKAMLFVGTPQRAVDIEFILRHRWVGKRVRVTLVEVLDDAPGKDGGK